MKIPSLPKLTEFDKFLSAAAGVLAQAVELGVLHGTALHYAQVASGAVAALLVLCAQPPSAKAPVVQVTPEPAPPAMDVIAHDASAAQLAAVAAKAAATQPVQPEPPTPPTAA